MWWLVEVGLAMLLIFGGTATYDHMAASTYQQQVQTQLASDTAEVWQQFADALGTYVEANSGPLSEGGTVTCANLQAAGDLISTFGNGTCTDPVGEQLVGKVSSPYGHPQSYVVLAANAPATTALQYYGLVQATSPNPSSGTSTPPPNIFEAFAMEVAQDITLDDQSNNTGVVIQTASDALDRAMPNPGAFMLPDSNSGYSSTLSQYFPSAGVTYPQTVPDTYGYNGYAIMVAQVLKENCVLTLSANPSSVIYDSGQPVQVTWNSPGASSCNLSFNVDGQTSNYTGLGTLSQSKSWQPTGMGTLSIEAICSSQDGMTCEETASVSVGCQVNLDVPNTIVAGESLPISWTAPGTGSCTISYSDGGAPQIINNNASGSGSTTYTPADAENLTVTALCSANGVSCSQSQQVTVTCQITLNVPSTATAQTPFTTYWTSTGTGNVCSLSYADGSTTMDTVSGLPYEGSYSYAPEWAEPLTVTATCVSPNGPFCQQSATIQVNSPMSLWASTTTPPIGQAFTVSWTALGTSSCTLSFDASGGTSSVNVGASGSYSYTPTTSGSLLITANCYAPNGTVYTQQITVDVTNNPCQLVLDVPTSVSAETAFTTDWTSSQTDDVCSLSFANDGTNIGTVSGLSYEGGYSYTPEWAEPLTVTATCVSPYGASCQQSATVQVGCPMSFWASTTDAVSGEAFTVYWTAPGTSSCTLLFDTAGSFDASSVGVSGGSGNYSFTPTYPNASLPITITCNAPDGTPYTQDVTVNVTLGPSFWQDATYLGSGWFEYSWFGVFYVDPSGWIYHNQLGWLLPDSSAIPSDFWFYYNVMNAWIYTSSSNFPTLYRETDGAWLLYEEWTTNPCMFYNETTDEWESWN